MSSKYSAFKEGSQEGTFSSLAFKNRYGDAIHLDPLSLVAQVRLSFEARLLITYSCSGITAPNQ